AALRASAGRLRDHLDARPQDSLRDVAYSLLATRSPLEHRLALPVASRADLRQALHAVAQRDGSTDSPGAAPPRVAFVFPGQGSQWVGMGRELLATEPAFREALAG